MRGGIVRAGIIVGLIAALALGTASGSAASGSAASGSSFQPQSVTFVSLQHGWALGTTSCASGRCLALRETTDSGRHWSAQSLPGALVGAADRRVPAQNDGYAAQSLDVRFADQADGWIYGGVPDVIHESGATYASTRPVLWSTHDGGSRWTRQTLPALGTQSVIYDLEAADGTAYLLLANARAQASVERTPVAHDDWTRASTPVLPGPAGGAQPGGGIVLAGATGWIVEGNDRGTDGSARLVGGHWVAWTPPCAQVGHSLALPAASSPSDLVAMCVMGGFAYPLSPQAPRGARLGSSWLYLSTNGGQSFHAGPQVPASAAGDAAYGGPISSPAPGTIVTGGRSGAGRNDLVASFDRGAHWTVESADAPLYVGFTSPTQGVAIVQAPSNALSLLMTFDGGRQWRPVAF
jgi:hypothetical protein